MSHKWFIRREGSEEGEFSAAELKSLARNGQLGPSHQVRRADRLDWLDVSQVRGLFDSQPPPLPATQQAHSAAVPPPPLSSGSRAPLDRRGEEAEQAAAVTDLYRSIYEPRIAGDASILRSEALTPKKLEGIGAYASRVADEQVLLVYDSTMFGVATEGITFTDRAIAWCFPDGNRGRVRYESIPSQSVCVNSTLGTVQSLYFGPSPPHRLPCKSLRQTTVDALAEFITSAARLSQGLSPSLVLPKAMSLARDGDVIAAVKLWESLLADDLWQFPSVLNAVRQATEEFGQIPELLAFGNQLASRANDRENGWLIPRVGQAPEEVSAAEVVARWRKGTLRRESQLGHVSDARLMRAKDAAVTTELREVYVSDTGQYEENNFLACAQALEEAGIGFEELLFFGPTSAKSDDAPGKPVVHLGLTRNELVLAWLPTHEAVVLERAPFAGIVWKYAPQGGDSELELATAARSFKCRLPQSNGSRLLLRVVSDLSLEMAEDSLRQDRRAESARFLDRVVVREDIKERALHLRDSLRAEEEVLGVYEGGHPDHVDNCFGTLRLDSEGFEFMSIAPESKTYFRIPYDRIIDFSSPQRGAMPAELHKTLFGRNSLVSAGLGVAASCVIPGGALLIRSLGSTLTGEQSSGPPLNRLTVVASFAGTPYRIYFDVVGQTVGEMSQKAKAFWSHTAKMKSRFMKTGSSGPAPRAAETGDPEVRVLLREIRDTLAALLELVQADVIGKKLVDRGAISASQLAGMQLSAARGVVERLGLPTSEASEKPVRRTEALVVACPKCSSRIRAGKPGVVKCVSCDTLFRLGEKLFAGLESGIAVEPRMVEPSR